MGSSKSISGSNFGDGERRQTGELFLLFSLNNGRPLDYHPWLDLSDFLFLFFFLLYFFFLALGRKRQAALAVVRKEGSLDLPDLEALLELVKLSLHLVLGVFDVEVFMDVPLIEHLIAEPFARIPPSLAQAVEVGLDREYVIVQVAA